VDAVLGEREVVRKSLNPFLEGLSLIAGTATVEERRLVMFVHMPELFRAVQGPRSRTSSGVGERTKGANRRAQILVVDDSELTRDMLVPLLERLRYSVSEAVDGADALQVIARACPDLLLTDLDMPVMDGLTLIERVRGNQATAHLPVVVFSTRGSAEDEHRALQAGANVYLVKSAFRAEELDRVVRRQLEEREAG
jgi:two-component system chemotaxis sensor kinase CheA